MGRIERSSAVDVCSAWFSYNPVPGTVYFVIYPIAYFLIGISFNSLPLIHTPVVYSYMTGNHILVGELSRLKVTALTHVSVKFASS